MAKRSQVTDLRPFPFGTARQLAAAVRTGKVSSLELLDAYLVRVEKFNPELNAIVVDRERARADAKAVHRAAVPACGGTRTWPVRWRDQGAACWVIAATISSMNPSGSSWPTPSRMCKRESGI